MGWGLGLLEDKATDLYHSVTGTPTADQKRHMEKDIANQVKAYKEQSELTRKEIERKRGEELAEKRRVEEKQIRGLRRNYRSSGILGSQQAQQDQSTKLGG